MSVRKSNEGKAIDATIRLIEERDGVCRSYMRDPENEGHRWPIDHACSFNGVLYAFEHTKIEPYAEYIERQRQNADLFDPITRALADISKPNECFQLHIPITASAGIKRVDYERVRAALIDWARKEASNTEAKPYGHTGSIKAAQLSDVPFSVALVRYAPAMSMGGRFDYRLVAPKSVSIRRGPQAFRLWARLP